MTHIGLRILSLIKPKLGYLEIFTINNVLYVILYIVNELMLITSSDSTY